jgi:phenylalanine-4-hydroxylase
MMEKEEKKVTGAYEKAAEQGIDPRCIPQTLDSLPPIGDEINTPEYSKEENDIWGYLYRRQTGLLEGRVCDEYIKGVEMMGFTDKEIPSLKKLSSVLTDSTGWKVGRVPGLIQAQNFFNLLRDRIFPSTDYIRGREEIDYTPAPDCFHDIFGHMPLLTNPNFANFYQKFGAAALVAKGEQQIFLERFHWFTVEFGLITNSSGRRIYGAGIVSSFKEVDHALSDEVEVIDFDPYKITKQEYEVWHLQPTLFSINSFEQLEDGFNFWAKKEGILN